MAEALTKSQIEKLGRRLKAGIETPDDLRLLALFRQGFRSAYAAVDAGIRRVTGMMPTARPEKTGYSIVAKLRRQSTTLAQIQDIAGCRLVVSDRNEQDSVVATLASEFSGARIIDRRVSPSHGYRAVHVVVSEAGLPIEIQVRTLLQDQWAQCVERVAFTVDPAVKYGGGPNDIRDRLLQISSQIAEVEAQERRDCRDTVSTVRRQVAKANVRIQLETVAIMAQAIKAEMAATARGST